MCIRDRSSSATGSSTTSSLNAATSKAMAASQAALSKSYQMLGALDATPIAPTSNNINYNYGGITITISGAGKDAKQLAQDLKSEIAKKTASK